MLDEFDEFVGATDLGRMAATLDDVELGVWQQFVEAPGVVEGKEEIPVAPDQLDAGMEVGQLFVEKFDVVELLDRFRSEAVGGALDDSIEDEAGQPGGIVAEDGLHGPSRLLSIRRCEQSGIDIVVETRRVGQDQQIDAFRASQCVFHGHPTAQ